MLGELPLKVRKSLRFCSWKIPGSKQLSNISEQEVSPYWTEILTVTDIWSYFFSTRRKILATFLVEEMTRICADIWESSRRGPNLLGAAGDGNQTDSEGKEMFIDNNKIFVADFVWDANNTWSSQSYGNTENVALKQ